MAGPMTEEAKAKLKRRAAEKRRANPLAKDYEPWEWLAFLDEAADRLRAEGRPSAEYDPGLDWWVGSHDSPATVGLSLKFVPQAVVDALGARLPGVRVRYRAGPNREKVTPVFPAKLLHRVLTLMRLDVTKYANCWSNRAIAAFKTLQRPTNEAADAQ